MLAITKDASLVNPKTIPKTTWTSSQTPQSDRIVTIQMTGYSSLKKVNKSGRNYRLCQVNIPGRYTS